MEELSLTDSSTLMQYNDILHVCTEQGLPNILAVNCDFLSDFLFYAGSYF